MPCQIPQSTDMKVLITLHANLYASVATSQLIRKMFKNIPDTNILTYCRYLHGEPYSNECSIDSYATDKETILSYLQRAQEFSPDICYFYLFNDLKYLKFIEELIDNLQLPYVVHMMDDWLNVEKENNYDNYLVLFDIVQRIIKKASLSYAISQNMAENLQDTFNSKFNVMHNFLSEEEMHSYTNLKNKTNTNFTIMYSGGLHKDINRKNIIEIAEVVSELSSIIPINFEIRTFNIYYNDALAWSKKYKNVNITLINPNDSYPQVLAHADLLLFTQNFEEHTQTYMRYSLANKLCEYLVLDIPILSYAPEIINTVSILQNNNAAICITTESSSLIRDTLLALYQKKLNLEDIQANAKALLKEMFSEEKILLPFEKNISTVANQKINLQKNMYAKALVMGNGPSLKGYDFKNDFKGLTTFGMNAAYRYWDTINWYPDYYCCLDLVVGISHKEEIKRLIEKSDEYGIKKFLLRDNLIQELGKINNIQKVINFDNIYESKIFLSESEITTGSHSCAWAAEMGYKDIILLGIDSNYVEKIPEASLNERKELVLDKTPEHNPNYFFDSYQQAGDKYNIPNIHQEPNRMVHRLSWKNLAHIFSKYGVLVINGSLQSKLDCFYKVEFNNIQNFAKTLKEQKYILDSFDSTENISFSEDVLLANYFNSLNTSDKTAEVKSIALKDYIEKESLEDIHCLRIDAKAFDLMVLKGFPFDKIMPEAILCEFENNKTLSLGYSTDDMINLLQEKGYTVYISEWNGHSWRGLIKAPATLFSPISWGRLIVFKNDPGEEKMKEWGAEAIKITASVTMPIVQPVVSIVQPVVPLNINFSKLISEIYGYSLKKNLTWGERRKRAKARYKLKKAELSQIPHITKRKRLFGTTLIKSFKHEDCKIYVLFSLYPIIKVEKNKEKHKFSFAGIQIFKKIKSKTSTKCFVLGLQVYKKEIYKR